MSEVYTYKVDPNILTRVYCKVNAVGSKWQFYHDYPSIGEAREAVETLNSYKEADELREIVAKVPAEDIKELIEFYEGELDHRPETVQRVRRVRRWMERVTLVKLVQP